MADALRFAPWLLIAIAVDPAAAEPRMSNLKLHSMEAIRFVEPSRPRHDPLLGRRLFEEETLPSWTLQFGSRADDRDRRGVRFSVRPGRGLKATARLRF